MHVIRVLVYTYMSICDRLTMRVCLISSKGGSLVRGLHLQHCQQNLRKERKSKRERARERESSSDGAVSSNAEFVAPFNADNGTEWSLNTR